MRKNRKTGIRPLMIVIMVMISVLLCMTFALLAFNNRSTRQLIYSCLSDKAGLYIEQLEQEAVDVSQTLKVMQIRDMDMLWELPDEIRPQDASYYDVWNDLKEYNFSRATAYGHIYSFYEYVYDADFLVVDQAAYFASSSRSPLISRLVREVRSVCEENRNGVIWRFFTVEDGTYLCGCFQRDGIAVGCVANLDELTEDIHITNLGYEGFLLFESGGQLYADAGLQGGEELRQLLPELQKEAGGQTERFIWETYTIRYLGNIRIVIDLSGGVLEHIEGVQILSVIIFLLLFVLVLAVLWYLYNGVLWPMKKFVDRLRDPEKTLYLNQKDDKGPLEIVYASEQFKKMYRELQSLRIDVYETELAREKAMLEYAQIQIRPHFFLNCMSVVQSIAELHHEDEIVHILDVFSEYMRYVLKDTTQKCRVSEEVRHVSNFMDIQQLCRPGTFTFSAIVEEDVEDCKILPLVLQVFAENSVKHGLIPGRCIEITVYITSMKIRDEDFLYLVFSDTGGGFPQQILEQLERDEPIVYDGCEHIGLHNTVKRLRMTYGEKAQIKFSNMKQDYGAVIEVTIPYEK